MNDPVYLAARRAGCSPREAEALAVYTLVSTTDEAAHRIGVTSRTLGKYLGRARDKLGVSHNAAAVAALLRDRPNGVFEVPFTETRGTPRLP